MPADKKLMLEHVFSIMDCFTQEHPELGVREVARTANLSSSTAGRLMQALREVGVLNQNEQHRTYRLGAKVLAWAEVFTATFDIRKAALPAMEELHRDTRETISLYVLEDNERVCVERLESPQNVRIVARIGRRLPLYAGSAGKLFLAFLPEARREEIFKITDFKPFTDQTITDLDILREELETIRQQGYAISFGEWLSDAAGVAAPIFTQNGEILAALTISGPAQRFNEAVMRQYAHKALKVAKEISRELGYVTGKEK